MKSKERIEARRLRANEGKSLGEIARLVGVSQGTVSLWVRDVVLTEPQKEELAQRNPARRFCAGAQNNREKAEQQRREFQEEGRRRCKAEPEDYRIMCALYWAEGNKDRWTAGMTNTDPDMLRLFVNFLRRYFGCKDEDFAVGVMAHLNNGLTVEQIHDFWLKTLGLPATCLRKFSLKTKYYPNVNKKSKRHMYGGCSVRVSKTQIVQTLYGSIQEMFGIDRPEWAS